MGYSNRAKIKGRGWGLSNLQLKSAVKFCDLQSFNLYLNKMQPGVGSSALQIAKLLQSLLSIVVCSVARYVLNSVVQRVARYKTQYFVERMGATFNATSVPKKHAILKIKQPKHFFCAKFVLLRNFRISAENLSYSVQQVATHGMKSQISLLTFSAENEY